MHPKLADHQSNERTFLAWIRTAIALMGFGFVVAKFGLFVRLVARVTLARPFSSSVVGVILVIVGGILAVISAYRYRRIQRVIDEGSYAPSAWLIWATAGSLLILATLLIIYLLQSTWE